MDPDTAARIEERWDRREAGDGPAGLAKLGDTEFSGAVNAGSTWLFMLNGRIVGSSGGSEATIGGSEPLTAYTAPHPSLPLLYAMWSRGGETEARYFTDDTPLPEVHETLSSGTFVGYVELSENVHSGDYYVVYYGGRALNAAFIGNTKQLVTGEEAFERADDEVGIYEVVSVGLDVRDTPDVEPAGAGGAAAPGSGAADSGGAVPGSGEPGSQGEPDDGDPVSDRTGTVGGDDPDSATRTDSPGEDDSDPTGGSEVESPAGEGPGTGDPGSAETTAEDNAPIAGDDTFTSGREAGEAAEESQFSEEAAWQEGGTIPALDPEESDPSTGDETVADTTGGTATGGPQGAVAQSPEEATTEAPEEPNTAPEPDRIGELEAELESLRERAETLTEERDAAVAERDRLQARLREVETGGAGDAGTDLDPEDALGRTDLLVRYGSKSEDTLADAGEGNATPESLGANLRLRIHPRFDAEGATVNGEAFESFLQGTLAYRFVRWLIEDLLFEIRETGNRNELRDLYDALPEVDRAEFDGSVAIEDENGQTRSYAFDVVLRDQMGQPLFVADIDGDRDPTSGGTMEELLDRSTAVVGAMDSLSGAFLVTASFFHNGVHEQVKEATKTGLLDRDSRASFVKAQRGGYHVCLIEAHDGEFHVSRPDL